MSLDPKSYLFNLRSDKNQEVTNLRLRLEKIDLPNLQAPDGFSKMKEFWIARTSIVFRS